MIDKIYIDDEGRELRVVHNTDNRCFMEIKTIPNDQYYSGFIVLDYKDLSELIKHLRTIQLDIKIVSNGEAAH